MTISEEKAKIRLWAKDLRTNIDLKIISKEITRRVLELKEYKSSKNVMSYLAKDIEISLNSLFSDSDKNWFLPAVFESKLLVIPYFPSKTNLTKNKFNIQEPELKNENYFDQLNKKTNLDLILVPGLCFDRNGNRIGFGKGFYDSFLKLNPNSLKIGLCPKECLLEKIPADEWDIRVDMVITNH